LIFSENSFRCGIHSIVTFPLFDVFIMLVIVASSISLASEVIINIFLYFTLGRSKFEFEQDMPSLYRPAR